MQLAKLIGPFRIARVRSEHRLHGGSLSLARRTDVCDRPPIADDDERLALSFDGIKHLGEATGGVGCS